MDDEKLILLVQSQEYIYDKSAVDFKLVHKKQQAWSKIAEVMGQSEENCMRRWTCLRDRYVREKREENQESQSGSSSQKKYRWPLKDTLEFLAPHIAPTRINRRLKYIKEDTNISLPIIVDINPCSNDSQPVYSPLHSPITERSPLSPTPESEPEIILTKKRKINTTEDSTETDKMFCEAVEAFKKVCKSREEKAQKIDDRPKDQNEVLYNFGKMIMATIGSFSVMNQTKAIQQVTNVVMNIKMENHAELQEMNGDFISY